MSDPEKGIETAPETLARLYNLTPAEARLTALVTAGAKLDGAADALQISRETARNQIKRVFAKTGTRGQADLVRLVLSGPAVAGSTSSRAGAR